MDITLVKLVKRGAEADIYRTDWHGSRAILKIRKPKGYRNPELDSRIRRQRTAKESQMISQVKRFGVPSPLVYMVDPNRSSILMQEIPGRPVHDLPDPEIAGLSGELGRLVGTMHRNGVMHGDLTTSNFVLSGDAIYVIDFGLSQNTTKPEDHAVDLRLIKEILGSAHADILDPAWRGFLAGYRRTMGGARHARITGIVADIEARGRYATVV